MKYLIAVLLLSVSLVSKSAEIEYVWTLYEGDPIWLSADGENWVETKLIDYSVIPVCDEVPQPPSDATQQISDCPGTLYWRQTAWYERPADGLGGEIKIITGRDPNRPPVSSQEMYGLQDRIENILTADNLESAFSSIKNLYADRQRLLEVHSAVRERLKASP